MIVEDLWGSLDQNFFGLLRIAGAFPFEFLGCWRSLMIILDRWPSFSLTIQSFTIVEDRLRYF